MRRSQAVRGGVGPAPHRQASVGERARSADQEETVPLMLTQEQGAGATSLRRRPRPAASRGRLRAIVTGLALVAASGLGVVPGSGGAPALAQTGANPPPPFSYWLVAADGGVFSFGGMPYRGSAGNQHLTKPIVGMAAKATATGYWLVASDGGIFSYGDAGFFGSTGALHLNKAIVGMAPTPSGLRYWLVSSDGGIFSYGDAAFRGSTGALKLAAPIVGMASGPDSNPYIPHSRGYDISWPQCGGTYPARPFDFAIVGVNDGLSYTTNPCFDSEWTWAGQGGSVYLNVNSPTGPNTAVDSTGPAGNCASSDLRCQSYNWGCKSAQQSMQVVRTAGAVPLVRWLEVEIGKG